MQTSRLKRILRLVAALHSGRSLDVSALATLLGVSKRTVFRDLDALHGAGMYFDFDRVRGRYSADQSVIPQTATFTQAEIVSLLSALRLAENHPSTISQKELHSATLKLESQLPRPIREAALPRVETLTFRHDPGVDPESIESVYRILEGAIVARTVLLVSYAAPGEKGPIEERIEPKALCYAKRAWWAIARATADGVIRSFRLDRIVSLKCLPESFEKEGAFQLDEYFGQAWCMEQGRERFQVRIRFTADAADQVDEVHWHPTQVTTRLNDGSLDFEASVDGLTEITPWILAFGKEAEVVAPEALRKLVALHAQAMHDRYQQDTPKLAIAS